jgi:iron(III) transport system permease protein
LAYLILLPLYYTQKLALADGAGGYSRALGAPTFLQDLKTTVVMGLGTAVFSLIVGGYLAIAASRLPKRLRFLQVVPVLPIVLPPVAAVVGWILLADPKVGYLNQWLRELPWWSHLSSGPLDVNTLLSIIVIQTLSTSGFVYVFVSAGLRNINAEAVEAARVHGSSETIVLFRVIIPMLRPALAYSFCLALLVGLGQFTAPLFLGAQNNINVLSTDVYQAVSLVPADDGAAAAYAAPLLFLGVALVIFQRIVLGDRTRFVTHGGKAFRVSDTRSWGAAVLISLYGLVAIGLPTLALINTAFSRYWNGRIQLSHYTLYAVRIAFHDPRLHAALINSITISLGAVLVSLFVGFVAASALVRGRHRFMAAAIDFLMDIPLVVPAVVFGLGFFFTFTQGPIWLYGNRWAMGAVYVILMVPFTIRFQLGSLLSLGKNYYEASRVSGAGELRTNVRVLLPLMRPVMCAGGGIMFVLLAAEFSASLLVRSPQTNVLGTLLYDYSTEGSYPLIAVMGLLIAVISAIALILAGVLGGRKGFERL